MEFSDSGVTAAAMITNKVNLEAAVGVGSE